MFFFNQYVRNVASKGAFARFYGGYESFDVIKPSNEAKIAAQQRSAYINESIGWWYLLHVSPLSFQESFYTELEHLLFITDGQMILN